MAKNIIFNKTGEELMPYGEQYFAFFNMVLPGTLVKMVQELFTKLPNPATLPTGTANGCSFSQDNNYLAVSHYTSPYITIYKRNGDTFTKLPNPATLPTGTANGCSFSQDNNYLAVSHYTSPYITIYKRNGDTFTKLPNPATLPTGTGWDCSFSQDNNYLAVAHNSSPYITIYKRNGDTFTKLPDPVNLPPGIVRGCSFSRDNNYLAVVHSLSPYITIYKRNGDTFTKLPDPVNLPPSLGISCSFSPDNNYLVVTYMTSPYITIYKRSGDTFTKLPNPATLPTGTANGCSFSQDNNYLAVAYEDSPYIIIYKRNGDTFTKLPNPANLPTDTSTGCSFSPDNNYLAVSHYGSPFITIYNENYNQVKPGDVVQELCYATEGHPGNSGSVLPLLWSNSLPYITAQPVSLIQNVGSSATLSVTVSGQEPFTYQWYKNGIAITGATQASYTKSNLVTGDAGNYTVVVTNEVGTKTSDIAVLVVQTPVVITQQPQNQTVNIGTSATFSVTATGASPLTYQWYKDSISIPGATSSIYTVYNVQNSNQGTYSCRITNPVGTVISNYVSLSASQPLAILEISNFIRSGGHDHYEYSFSYAFSGGPGPSPQYDALWTDGYNLNESSSSPSGNLSSDGDTEIPTLITVQVFGSYLNFWSNGTYYFY